MSTIETIRQMLAYDLAQSIDCGTPDGPESTGANLLDVVRIDTLDAIERGELDFERACEIADAAPSVYTHQRWQQFVDLCAYREDLEDTSPGVEDWTDLAGVALYQIARRLVEWIADELGVEL